MITKPIAFGGGLQSRLLRLGQSALRQVFPPQCISCGACVDREFALCGPCWRETHFAMGLVCDGCGTPLPGQDEGRPEHCDDCLAAPRPWTRGRSALVYRDNGRRLVLALKHGDRLDLARPMADWMLRAAAPILSPGLMVAPVPLHRWRLFRRRYNQSAHLSSRLARLAGLDHCPDLLLRRHATCSQEGRSRADRFENVDGAIIPHPRRADQLAGRQILLVDDVMTSGATLAAATDACLMAGAAEVRVLVLARVAKDG